MTGKRGRVAIIVMAIGALLVFIVLPALCPPARHPIVLIGLLAQSPPERLPIPVDGVGPHALANTWGAPRGSTRRHEGIDIFARRNTPIRSTTDGIVEKKGWNRLGGRVVTVLGPGGFHHYYAHLDGFGDVDLGDVVRCGALLGYVGDTGNAAGTPTHLHYGIYRLSGGAINPYPLLVSR